MGGLMHYVCDSHATGYHLRVIRTFHKSARNAFRGIAFVWQAELNFRIQVACAILSLIGAWLFGFTASEVVAVLFCDLLVLGAEMVNTIVEDLLDHLHPGHHVTVGRIKDISAGFVLLQSLGALAIWLFILSHHVHAF